MLNQGIRILLKAQKIFLFSVAFNRTHMCAQVHMFISVSRMEDNLECVSFSGVQSTLALAGLELDTSSRLVSRKPLGTASLFCFCNRSSGN